MALPPTLSEWVAGCGPSHPLTEALADGSRLEEWQHLETLLMALENARPPRLAGKRREFRSLRDLERYGDLLSELRVAAWLVDRDVRLEFGQQGEPQPDLVLPDFGLGIEVTRRQRTPDTDLRRAISRGVRAAIPSGDRPAWLRSGKELPHPVVRVSGHPITIRSKVLEAIADEVEEAIGQDQKQVHAVLRPARDGYSAVVANISLYGGTSAMPRVVHNENAVDLTIPMLDIEDLVVAALEDHRKLLQGASMPSILLIDASRLSDLLWLRSPGTWADRLGALLKPEHTFVGVGIAALMQEPRLGLGVGEGATPTVRQSLILWADQMGMRSATTNEPRPFGRQGTGHA